MGRALSTQTEFQQQRRKPDPIKRGRSVELDVKKVSMEAAMRGRRLYVRGLQFEPLAEPRLKTV